MDIENFKNQVYTTRKSRINASERLMKKEGFIQGINIYYSCILIAFSVYGLKNQSYILSLLSTIASISLTLSLLYVGAQKYSERSAALKKNYIQLQELYYKIEGITNETPELIEYREEYIELLNNSENHSELDYLKAQVSLEKASVKNTLKYYAVISWYWFLKVLMVVAPIVVIVLAFVFLYK